ncbi:hypothetical protein [Pseudomonas sp. 28 E 9]|uniref:hypothetical protein n=1 Tax=Pseudomonas sp. 28 E 9 TaxID=1844098 RepID=UPI0008124DA5|nr:hypothetical protein [Pseudomonas sp. 28 E 9]CRM05353.1 hypothetical protein [Pseudomonas sp. 28 E 9]
MTTNQTIDGVLAPLELLAAFATYVADSPNAIMRARAKELRTLLDAPTDPTSALNRAWQAGYDTGYYAKNPAHERPAAQPQGEPVARHPDAIIEGVMTSVGITHAIYASTVSLKHGDQVKLYAEQPAPVVSVPERLVMTDGLHSYEYVTGHNDAIGKMLGVKP